ncbi:FAD-dependent oxidoreductase [Psychrobacter sp. AH5]|uniref:FAD-dependent oxidoreductase n=1 Tax=Psychrobacter sp. AH5 TaxID=2937433 RepID=UPI00333EC9C6
MKNTAVKRAKHLLLAGGGHAHIGLLRRLSDKPLKDVAITLITEQPQTLYSGMLPGWMAGHYNLAEITIDMIELCRRAEVSLLQQPIIAVDAETQTVVTSKDETLDYQVLSLNTGADTDLHWLKSDDSEAEKADDNHVKVVPVRPLANFVLQWQQILQEAKQADQYKLAVVGAGAAAAELVMAAQFALQQISPKHQAYLVCGEQLLSDFAQGFKSRVIKQLQRHNIDIIYERAESLTNEQLLTTKQSLPVNAVIAATGVMGSAWSEHSNLATVENGFIAVNSYQQSISHANVFAVGDVCSRVDRDMAHSGVHAVFGGAVAADNLLAYLAGKPLKSYQPKNRTLYLLSCGDKYAIGSWGRYSVQGRWVWALKKYIDKRFVNKK